MKKYFTIVISMIVLTGCSKDKLNLKPNQSFVVPKTVADFQSLLDNAGIMNTNSVPVIAEIGADNFYMPFTNWNAAPNPAKYSFIWSKDPFVNVPPTEWLSCYTAIYYANVVLEGLDANTEESSTQAFRNAKGNALFFRAHALWQLAQVFCKPYDPSTANTELGLPIRLGTNPLLQVQRSSIQVLYEQILGDLLAAKELVDEATAYTLPTRAIKPTVDALLSMVYMSMRAYEKALPYAIGALNKLPNAYDLIDYNSLNQNTTSNVFTAYNKEVLFHATLTTSQIFSNSSASPVDTNLYKSYSDKDLRKSSFYLKNSAGLVVFKASYTGSSLTKFGGIAVDELYLNRAECYARSGDIVNAMKDLNTLMIKRWKNDGSFVQFTAVDKIDAVNKVLTERRKELVYRGRRWTDLRRLNLEGANITLQRILNGITYTLRPNSPNYVYPIPKNETDYNPIIQNIRE